VSVAFEELFKRVRSWRSQQTRSCEGS